MSYVGSSTSTDLQSRFDQMVSRFDTAGKTGDAGAAKAADGAVGTGAAAGTQDAPDALPAGGGSASVMLASLSMVMSSLGPTASQDMSLKLQAAVNKLKDTVSAGQKEQIKNDQKMQELAAKEKGEKLKASEDKMKEAAEANKHHSVWEKVKLAFSYLGAALAIAAGAVMFATLPVAGQVAGALLIASGVVMLTMAIDETVAMTNKDGMGMFAQAAYSDAIHNHGMTSSEAKDYAGKVSMGVSFALMGVSLLASLPSMFLGTGEVELVSDVALIEKGIEGASAASDIEKGVTTATETVEVAQDAKAAISTGQKIKDAFAELRQLFKTGGRAVDDSSKEVMSLFQKINKVLQGVNDAGGATASAGATVTQYQADDATADAKTSKADAKRYEALETMLDSMIDMAMQQLKGAAAKTNDMVGKVVDAQNDIGNTLSHARF